VRRRRRRRRRRKEVLLKARALYCCFRLWGGVAPIRSFTTHLEIVA